MTPAHLAPQLFRPRSYSGCPCRVLAWPKMRHGCISTRGAGVGKRHGGRKRGQQAEEAAEPAADERERLHREAVATHAGRVLATLDADVQVAECASTLRLAGLLQELQAAVEVRRCKHTTPQPATPQSCLAAPLLSLCYAVSVGYS